MALQVADRVQVTSSTYTTSSFTLGSAATGFQSFSALTNGNTTYYAATDSSGNWEVGYGTYTSATPALSRTTILSSSNSGSVVTFSGTVNVFITYPSEKVVIQDGSNNVSGYAITGGTIDNTVIGGTTPSTGTFTTITGQTETLKGTGNNYFTQTSTLSTWLTTNTTITTGQTDPFSGTNAVLLTKTATAFANTRFSTSALSIGEAFTVSVYAQAGTNNTITLLLTGDNGTTINGRVSYNLSTQVATNQSSISLISSLITSVGGGWYRCILSATVTVNSSCVVYIYPDLFSSANAGTVTIYGPQLEIGSTVNTYVPTTSTAVYGTPTLSFSGVSTIGLQNDGSLFVQPAGTGALQAQQTTSSATGGNARGANAVDWQTSRATAAQVASALASVISGGRNNTSNNQDAFIGGGFGNTAGGGPQATVVGGASNTAYEKSVVVGGSSNNALGYFNFIGGGFTNSGTSSSAVTTQATTTVTSGSTAVTLSASNANIKAGQLITGTGIVAYTYVSVISGTSLTLSQNANASGSPTLSFYTPHGVVVGGGNNQATGAYSFVGGGGDAGNASYRNLASGDYSVVVGGTNNQATGLASFVGGGGTYSTIGTGVGGHIASGVASTISGGLAHRAVGLGSTISGGDTHNADGISSTVVGGRRGTTRLINGYTAMPSCVIPINGNTGTTQAGLLVIGVQSTTTGTYILKSDTSTANTANQMTLAAGQTGTVTVYTFRVLMSAHNTATTDAAGWEIKGVISRASTGVASTTLVGTPTVTLLGATSGAISAGWGTLSSVAAVADTTNGALQITATGVAATTINWSARVETNELTY